MRYIQRPTDYDESTLHVAESLFERYVGRRLSVDMYEETVPIVRFHGSLRHTPVVEVLSIRARCENSAYVPWALDGDVKPDSVTPDGRISLPSTIFGESYTSASVTYLAGMSDVPDEVERCVLEIVARLAAREMDEWSGPSVLSDEAQETIDRYRERR